MEGATVQIVSTGIIATVLNSYLKDQRVLTALLLILIILILALTEVAIWYIK